MSFIRTVAAFAITIFVLLVFTPLGILSYLISFICLKKAMNRFIYGVANCWAKIVIGITGCVVDVRGKENIPSGEAVCFTSNHVGIFDIILALAYIGSPFGFIAKKELMLIPVLNLWIPILGGFYIDRSNLRKAVKTINHGIKKIEQGGNMLIFPEGTRSKGRGLLPFRSGSIKLATNSRAPIVPIAIAGSYEVFEKDYRVHAVPVQMIFCPPIYTADMKSEDRRHKLADQVKDIIATTLTEFAHQ